MKDGTWLGLYFGNDIIRFIANGDRSFVRDEYSRGVGQVPGLDANNDWTRNFYEVENGEVIWRSLRRIDTGD